MIRAAAVTVVLVAGAVLRFIEDRSPKDPCAQLAPSYKAARAKQYGPCLAGMRQQPKASHVRTSVRARGLWLITGAKQIP